MRLKWIGHAMFRITAKDGTTVVTDPFEPGCFDGALSYACKEENADLVTVSHHSHADHNAVDRVTGNPLVVDGEGSFSHGDITLKGVATFHDESQGAERGNNTVFAMDMDGLRLVHLGDLGHLLTEAQCKALGPAHVTLAPFGGHFTIDGDQALAVARSLNSRILVPMHFKTPKVQFPIRPVDDFLQGSVPVRRVDGPEVDLAPDDLPDDLEIWVLDFAG